MGFTWRIIGDTMPSRSPSLKYLAHARGGINLLKLDVNTHELKIGR